MTSERVYVWTWLDGREDPVVAGALDPVGDRIGANDFQPSAEVYVPRETHATLAELSTGVDRLQAGEPFSDVIDGVLNAGS